MLKLNQEVCSQRVTGGNSQERTKRVLTITVQVARFKCQDLDDWIRIFSGIGFVMID